MKLRAKLNRNTALALNILLLAACGGGGSSGGGAVSTCNSGLSCVVNNGGAETIIHSFANSTTDGSYPRAGLIQDASGNLYGTTLNGGANDAGTVFKITPAGVESILHSFTGGTTDGANPYAGLIQDASGNLYGTTSNGGTNSNSAGTVFKITPTGFGSVETLLHSFANNSTTDGDILRAGLIQDASGNLYGTTAYGGANGAGTVFKITPAGVETILHSFANNTTDGGTPYAGLIQDASGNLYGTTAYGGANGAGTVFKITPAGAETILHSFTNTTSDGGYPEAGLIQDASGNLYGTTYRGGANNAGTVFKITPAGGESIVHSFTNTTTDGGYPEAGLIQDASGNLYGTTFYGGANGEGTVFKITPAGAETILHSFANNITDGDNPEAGLIQDASGNLYGTTTYGGANGAGTVFKIAP